MLSCLAQTCKAFKPSAPRFAFQLVCTWATISKTLKIALLWAASCTKEPELSGCWVLLPHLRPSLQGVCRNVFPFNRDRTRMPECTNWAQHARKGTHAGLVNAWTDIQRMRGKNDHNCIKCWSLMQYFMCRQPPPGMLLSCSPMRASREF